MAANEHDFMIDGQKCHFHEDNANGITSGHFHTYDHFHVSSEHPTRKIHVFVPVNYLNAQGKRYPVLYMNDGETSFWRGGVANKSWDVSVSIPFDLP